MKKSYKELDVGKLSIDLAIEIYKHTQILPSEEKFALIDQMRRAAVSVPSNIAEGMGRGHNKEILQFLYIARGSLYELETQIEICVLLNYLTDQKAIILDEKLVTIGKMLNSLISYFKNTNKR